MKNLLSQRSCALAIALTALFAGFQTAASASLDAALARASELKQPLILLVAETGRGKADNHALKILESKAVKNRGSDAIIFALDISVSRNRAAATRFHAVETPLLLCLTPRGVIASRDEGRLTTRLVLQRIEEVARQSPVLDAKLVSLEEATGKNPADIAAQFDLTDFLLAHHNAMEAIPPLAAMAHSEANTPDARLRAWVALVRAHFWIAEPEKARREAEEMMAALGTAMPEARAAGEFVLGSQDATTIRTARARTEFEAAIAAAPNSPYGKQAAEALANLPQGGQQ